MKKTDYLKEDPPIYKQDWSVISILNPKDKVVEKNIYYVNNFLVNDVNKSINAQASQMVKKLNAESTNRIKDLLEKLKSSVNEDDKRMYELLNMNFKKTLINEDEYIDECRRLYKIDQEELMDRYKIFLVNNRVNLDNEFEAAFSDECSVRGVKNRGNYGSYREAEARAKEMREYEEAIDVFVAPVGKWCPVDFEADEVQDQNYMEERLNNLMAKYHENIQQRNDFFNKRKKDMVENAENNKVDNIKNRLRAKLQAKKNNKIKQELAEIKGEN
jgi:hypothetical protein